jgi:peptide/nickel transport system permease protein
MGLGRYIARRAVYTVILLFVIVIFNFFLFQIFPFIFACPGVSMTKCAESLYLGPGPVGRGNLSAIIAAQRQKINISYGFYEPVPVRFMLYFKNMFTFNFGFNVGSLLVGPVLSTIEVRVPYTVLLLGVSTIASFLIGIGIGVVAAARRGKVLDVSSMAVLLFVQSLPVFFLGGMLMLSQLLVLHTFYEPVSLTTLNQHGVAYISGVLSSFFMPFLALTLISIGGVFLTQRAVMIDTMGEDYILMARAKGLPERTVLYKHAFRNAVLPIATAFALSLAFILGGAVITETVFSWPGLGQAIYFGVTSIDFPLEQAMFFIITMMVLIAVFIVDCTYGFLDPRVSTG